MCVCTYHVCNNYVTYVVAMRPYFSRLRQFRRLLCVAATVTTSRWIPRSRGNVDVTTEFGLPEWIRTLKARLVFRYEISDLFRKPWVAKSLLLSVTEFWLVIWSSMQAMMYPYVVLFDLFWYLLTMGSECGWGLGEGSNFQLFRGPQN